MSKDRLNINKQDRAIIDSWREKNILGFEDNSVNNLEIFIMMAGMGLKEPKPIKSKEGYIRYEYINTEDKAFLSSILLGKKIENNEDIDLYANEEKTYEEAEKCATSGIEIFNKIVLDSGHDTELIEKKLLSQLDFLYQTNVGR